MLIVRVRYKNFYGMDVERYFKEILYEALKRKTPRPDELEEVDASDFQYFDGIGRVIMAKDGKVADRGFVDAFGIVFKKLKQHFNLR
jgi:hypothetical protein